MTVNIQDELELPVNECHDLVEQIWESIGEVCGQPELTAEQIQELRTRAAAHAAEPTAAISWEQVKESALDRARK